MKKDDLLSISPLDGRYSRACADISEIFSEYNLIKKRVYVEVKWFIFLSNLTNIKELPKITIKDEKFILNIANNFTLSDAKKIKGLEKITNHDVKAVEYFIKSKFEKHVRLKKYKEYIHICCTSEDINNISYGLMINEAKLLLQKRIILILSLIKKDVKKYSRNIMISHTHGQPATPTTMGKEFLIFYKRIENLIKKLEKINIKGKLNGATGNYSAHSITFPNINWPLTSKKFINSLGLVQNEYTTQIESHDYICEISNTLMHINLILIGFTQDIWTYISKNYFIQKNIKREVGSSTMPHKINPINFENAEGNLGMANSILRFLSDKLVISRLQRDLSDSTVLRNIGISFGYSYVAYENLTLGLSKISINQLAIDKDLINAWEILAEPIQMIARKYYISNSYELLKNITRGQKITKEQTHSLIKSLDIPEKEKKNLLKLTPQKYIGYATKLCNGKL